MSILYGPYKIDKGLFVLVFSNQCSFSHERKLLDSNSGSSSRGGAALWLNMEDHNPLCLYAPCLPILGVKGESFMARSSLFCCVDYKGGLADPAKPDAGFMWRLDGPRALTRLFPPTR